MTSLQKTIKYLAMAFALFLIVSILSGIFSALGLFSNVFDSEDALGEMKTYSVSGDIQELKLNINAARLIFTEGDVFSVQSNNKYIKVTEQGNCLEITETERNYSNIDNKIRVEICIPKGTTFQKANLCTGAGQVTVDRLAAEDLYLELGAGQVQIGTLEASRSSKISGGAGQVTVKDGTLQNLSLDMGVGAVHLTLIGKADDYSIELDKGLGAATLDGENLPDGAVRGNGENTIDIDGGVGGIYIEFEKLAA